MTTTTTTGSSSNNVFIEDFSPWADYCINGIIQTRKSFTRPNITQPDYCLQIDTKEHTALIYAIHSKRVYMKVQVCGWGEPFVISAKDWIKRGLMSRPMPNMYAASKANPIDPEGWNTIFMNYMSFVVDSIHVIDHEIYIHVKYPSGGNDKVLVCNNAPWVFSQMLNPDAPTPFSYDYASLPYTKLCDLYKALVEASRKAEIEEPLIRCNPETEEWVQVDWTEYPERKAYVLNDRARKVTVAMHAEEKGFLAFFNEDKSVNSSVVTNLHVLGVAEEFADRHIEWYTETNKEFAQWIWNWMTTIPPSTMKEYHRIICEERGRRYKKRPASEISAATGGA